jgi:glycosyltransferase involved in cell wall biosynthesis
MAFDLITVALFGFDEQALAGKIKLRNMHAVEADDFDLRFYPDDSTLARVLVEVRPQVLVSRGQADSYKQLWSAPLETRKRWISLDPDKEGGDPAAIADAIMACFMANATTQRLPETPLISVFTPSYKTGARIERPLKSLQAQSYNNWEWIIYDDSPDDGKTFSEMAALARHDHRIAAYRSDRPCGAIGEVKRRACGLTRGQILVELDHDDELTFDALAWVAEAHRKFPDAGFFYTDCAEVFEDGRNATYSEGWGLGFGSYRQELYNGRALQVTNYPSINSKTMRHIVGVPNHLRAWTRAAYLAAGGYNPEVHVCDDYELLIRTFLTTRMVHIKKLGYIQYYNAAGNTQRSRNKEIQRLTRYFMQRYNDQIHRRFLELGVDDFIWREGAGGGRLAWDTPHPKVVPIANYELA